MAGKEWSKDNIRQVLRALKQQKYIERWAQIKWRITGERPPPMSAEDMDRVQEMFALVEVPFSMFKSQGRKNMLNYNYVFRQIFVLLDLPQHLPFFPLLKSRQKLSELDSIWNRICEYNDWHFFPTLSSLVIAAAFRSSACLIPKLALVALISMFVCPCVIRG
eukprot:tig00020567_g11522.t1